MSSIWAKEISIADINRRGEGCMVEHLGIKFLEIGPDYLKASMPVDHRTKQPIGLLHGGASVALAETVASTAGNLTVDNSKLYCVGLEINANHVRSITKGEVIATSRAVHIGRSTQVWETRIEQHGKLACVSRMTLAVLRRESATRPKGSV